MADFFPDISRVVYEGPDSKNPLSFRHYDADAIVEGRTMREHLRFACAFWHTMRNDLSDPFGSGTASMPWDDGSTDFVNIERRIDAFFEFLDKMGIDFYCFHDRDISPEADTIDETNRRLDRAVEILERRQDEHGKQLLWGTACLFTHPRYASGAATSPRVEAFCHAAAQVKAALEATHRLGGEGYVFWGGREGYGSLINTDLKRERAQLARLLLERQQRLDQAQEDLRRA